MGVVSVSQARPYAGAKPSRAALAAFDGHARLNNDALLREDEASNLLGVLPKLFDVAVEMGVADKPLTEWSREELMRFLALAVRSAMPLLAVSHHDPEFNDRIPF